MPPISQRTVPEGLRNVMRSLTKEILHEKPTDIYEFSRKYFESALQEQTEFGEKAHESTGSHAVYNEDLGRKKIPLNLVYNIIPDEIPHLIREFIKEFLRENPTNIHTFAVNYFNRLQKGGNITEYTTYENYIKRKEAFSFAKYIKCECGRTVSIDELHTEHTNTKKSYSVHLLPSEKLTNNADCENKEQNAPIRVMSQLSAALIIQRIYRKFCKNRVKRSQSSTLEYLKENDTFNDKISGKASYTTESTPLMSADSSYKTVQSVVNLTEMEEKKPANIDDAEEKSFASNSETFGSTKNANNSTNKDMSQNEMDQNKFELSLSEKIKGNHKSDSEHQTETDALNQNSTLNQEEPLLVTNRTISDSGIDENISNIELFATKLNVTPAINTYKNENTSAKLMENEINHSMQEQIFSDHSLSEFNKNLVTSETNESKNEITVKEIFIGSAIDNSVEDIPRTGTPNNSINKSEELFSINKSMYNFCPENKKADNDAQNRKAQSEDNNELQLIPNANATAKDSSDSLNTTDYNEDINIITEKSEIDNTNNIANDINISTVSKIYTTIKNLNLVNTTLNLDEIKIQTISESSNSESPWESEQIQDTHISTKLYHDVPSNLNLRAENNADISSDLQANVLTSENTQIEAKIKKNDAASLGELNENEINKLELNNKSSSIVDPLKDDKHLQIELEVVQNPPISLEMCDIMDEIQNVDHNQKATSTSNSVVNENNELLKDNKYILNSKSIEVLGDNLEDTKPISSTSVNTNGHLSSSETIKLCQLKDNEEISLSFNMENERKRLKDYKSESESENYISKIMIPLATETSSDLNWKPEDTCLHVAGNGDHKTLNKNPFVDSDPVSHQELSETIIIQDNLLVDNNDTSTHPKPITATTTIPQESELYSTHQGSKNCQDNLGHILENNESLSEKISLTEKNNHIEIYEIRPEQLLKNRNDPVHSNVQEDDSRIANQIGEISILQHHAQDESKKQNEILVDTPSTGGFIVSHNPDSYLTRLEKENVSLSSAASIGTQNSCRRNEENKSIDKYVNSNTLNSEYTRTFKTESVPDILTAGTYLSSTQDIQSYVEHPSKENPIVLCKNYENGESLSELNNSENSNDLNEESFEQDSLEVEIPMDMDFDEDSLEAQSPTTHIQEENKVHNEIERSPTYLYGILSPKHKQVYERNNLKNSTVFTIPFHDRKSDESNSKKRTSKITGEQSSTGMCQQLVSPTTILDTEIRHDVKINMDDLYYKPIKTDVKNDNLVSEPQENRHDIMDITYTVEEAGVLPVDNCCSTAKENKQKDIQPIDSDSIKDVIDDNSSLTASDITIIDVMESETFSNNIQDEITRSINTNNEIELEEINKETLNNLNRKVDIINENYTETDDKGISTIQKCMTNETSNYKIYNESAISEKEPIVKAGNENSLQMNTLISQNDKGLANEERFYNAALKIQKFFMKIIISKRSANLKLVDIEPQSNSNFDISEMVGSLIVELINSTEQLESQEKTQIAQSEEERLKEHRESTVNKNKNPYSYNMEDINDLPIESKEFFNKAAVKIQRAFQNYLSQKYIAMNRRSESIDAHKNLEERYEKWRMGSKHCDNAEKVIHVESSKRLDSIERNISNSDNEKVNWFVGTDPIIPTSKSENSTSPYREAEASTIASPSRHVSNELLIKGKQDDGSFFDELVSATNNESTEEVTKISRAIPINLFQTDLLPRDSIKINQHDANIDTGYVKDETDIDTKHTQNVENAKENNSNKKMDMDKVKLQSLQDTNIEHANEVAFLPSNDMGINILEHEEPFQSDILKIKITDTISAIQEVSVHKTSKTNMDLQSAVNSVDDNEVKESLIDLNNKEMQKNSIPNWEDDEIILKRLQSDETRENSAESNSVILENEHKSNVDEEYKRSDLARSLHKSVTIDTIVKYIEPVENDKSNGSFYLDEDTSETIRRKILAYSISEADSDDMEKSAEMFGMTMEDLQKNMNNDFNISTALLDATGTSTETESTIVSAATKIQAGARGFLTRRRLCRMSAGTKSPSQGQNKASFGNDAINESLDKLIAEEAAKKIQCAYRKHYRRVRMDSASYRSTPSLEKSLAARRLTLQRGDALRNYSTPDEDYNGNVNDKRLQTQTAVASTLPSTVQIETSSDTSNAPRPDVYQKVATTATDSGKKIIDNKRKFVMRQNSMPVQIASDLFRVIPKHMRKRIKSADGVNKTRRHSVLKD